MKQLKFYHDGCTICASVGQEIVNLIGLSNLDIIHVGLNPSKMQEAEKLGVKAYPALVTDNGNVLHFNVQDHEGNLTCLF
ncbi:MAG: thioredoxin family protein [Bacteroidota bacterium]|nr:thioredoxin family protein [Bacteroidota bacterium]